MNLPLFIYGSLRDPRVRAHLLGTRADLTTRPAVLRGYARQTVPELDYPFVVPDRPESQVDGELLFGLQAAEYAILDTYEDVDEGLYQRVIVRVQTTAASVDAWTYLKGPGAPS